jgi:hypothetical protein
MSTTRSIRCLLQQTLDDIECRSQIEECGRDLVSDVEFSLALEEKILARREMAILQRRVREQEQIIEESYAVRNEEVHRNRELAKKVTVELWNMSREIGSLLSVKDRYKKLLMEHDELLAKFLLSEEHLAEVKALSEQKGNTVSTLPSSSDSADNLRKDHETEIISADNKQSDKSEMTSAGTKPSDTSEVSNVAIIEMRPASPPSQPKDAPLTLDQLETEILLHIFLFLDPLDVLNTAQVNIAMYSRVDALFNPGETEESDNNQVSALAEDSNQETQGAISSVTVEPIPSSQTDKPATALIPTTSSVSTVSLTPSVATLPSPQLSSQEPKNAIENTSSNQRDSSSVKHVTTPLSNATGSRGIFSMLQPMVRNSTSPLRRFDGQKPPPQQQTQEQQPYQPLNAAMASSMAAKLSDAELNAIILMTERLKRKEDLAAQYKTEKDTLVAKLEGTESVKQFLIGKVREMENALNASFSNEMKAAQQAESDQEVIAYLDGRVQELERQYKSSQVEIKSALKELDSTNKKFTEKATVMGDMLQFERQKLQEKEREWKATKKVLVKEVKSLRAQVAMLQAEQDSYRDEKDSGNWTSNNTIDIGKYFNYKR